MLFFGRELLIATKHRKEKAIAPLLEEVLGVKSFTVEDFDTDVLGTFTGEVERKEDPLTTARNKCMLGMQLYNCDLVIASEGSFGPHPSLLFVHADDEILMLIDKKNDLEISVRELSIETNFNGREVSTTKELTEFANLAKFPSHGLIIRKAKGDFSEITKGITDWEKLENTFRQYLEKYGAVYVETDMRAMYNPTRMRVIEKATKKLIDKINSCCPECNTPGFGISIAKMGLPCLLCNFPTRSVLSYLYSCQKCAYTKEDLYPNKKTFEDPMYCDICNP